MGSSPARRATIAIEIIMNDHYLGFFGLSFLSATVIPGTSEVYLIYLLDSGLSPQHLLIIGTAGNVIGGVTTYFLGRGANFVKSHPNIAEVIRQRGSVLLLLSWVPFFGDILCLGAGWLKLRILPCLFAMTLGKALRYFWIIFFYKKKLGKP